MTLTSAIRTATSSLGTISGQASLVSRNISGVGDPNYVRRESQVITGLNGTTDLQASRNIQMAVYGASLLAGANAEKSQVISSSLNQLATLQGLDDYAQSPAGLISSLQGATEAAVNNPSDRSTLSNLAETARTTVMQLGTRYTDAEAARRTADTEIRDSVARINSLLEQFKKINDLVVQGSKTGKDVFDEMDIRDRLVVELSEEIGLNVVRREHDDYVLVTDNATVLFERSARQVAYVQTAGSRYGEVRIDGLDISGDGAVLPLRSGKLAGNLTIRDVTVPVYQSQLDEIARGLISVFKEVDISGSGKPDLAGLIGWSGGPGLPPDGVRLEGLATMLSLTPNVDPALGGNVERIRDGGMNNDPDYNSNVNGFPGYADRLIVNLDAFESQANFDAVTELDGFTSVVDLASSSLDWMSAKRSEASSSTTYAVELAGRFKETLQNETGPNLDYEMSRLLEVERAYQATARLLSVVDEMLATLLEVAR